MKNRIEVNTEAELLKVKNGKYYIKWPNLDIPLVLNKYFFDRLVEEQRVNTPPALVNMS